MVERTTMRLKRVRADRPAWRRHPDKGFTVLELKSGTFSGHLAILCIDSVKSPWTCSWDGQSYCIGDEGFCWLTYFPSNARHVVHAVFDKQGRFVHLYVDICLSSGLDSDGVPYFDDLFLDIVVLPCGKRILLDSEELDAALSEGTVTTQAYEQAKAEAERVMRDIESGTFPYLPLACEHYNCFVNGEKGRRAI